VKRNNKQKSLLAFFKKLSEGEIYFSFERCLDLGLAKIKAAMKI